MHPAVLAAFVAGQTVLLSVPWLAVRRTYHSAPNPALHPDHARTARAARWAVDYPASVGLVVLAAVVLPFEHTVVPAVYLALVTRLLVFEGNRARVSAPGLGLVFPWLVAPLLSWVSVLLVVPWLLGAGDASWVMWVVGVAAVFGLPAQALGLLAEAGRAAVAAVRRLVFARRLHGRWVTNDGWKLCDVRPSPDGVTLAFADTWALLPLPNGEPPDFLVRVVHDRDWQPADGEARSLRLADHPGPGPITEALFAATPEGIRAARARLDDELVVVIQEVRVGGDDFFEFITALRPAGRSRSTA